MVELYNEEQPVDMVTLQNRLREKDVPAEVSAVAGRSCTQRLDYFIHNIVTSSRGRDDICMSKEAEEAMRTMREFMFRNVYRNPVAK